MGTKIVYNHKAIEKKNGVRNGKRHRSIQETEKTETRNRNITARICSRIHQEMVFM